MTITEDDQMMDIHRNKRNEISSFLDQSSILPVKSEYTLENFQEDEEDQEEEESAMMPAQ